MTQMRWAADDGSKRIYDFPIRDSGNEGSPMMCNLVCSSIGRHTHISNCRAVDGDSCSGADVQHINKRLTPDQDKPKDAITHRLYWRRMGARIVLLSSLYINLNDISRLQRLRTHLISFNKLNTEVHDQTHILATSRQILKNGTLPHPRQTKQSSLVALATQCVLVCPDFYILLPT